MSGFPELVGKKCQVEFDLPDNKWPISGFPAWVYIDAVDMPMVKVRSAHGGKPLWVNVNILKTIEVADSDKNGN